jgi:hypothetical protein
MAIWRWATAIAFFALTGLGVAPARASSGDDLAAAAVVFPLILALIASVTAAILTIAALLLLKSEFWRPSREAIFTPGLVGSLVLFGGGWPLGEAIGIFVAYSLVKERASRLEAGGSAS